MRNMSEAETKVRIAKRVAEMLPDGGFVNLGVGIPTMAVDYLPADKHIYIQTENGMLGVGPKQLSGEAIIPNLINASRTPVTETPGCCYFDSATSFAMIRSGRMDATVIGAIQINEAGAWQIGLCRAKGGFKDHGGAKVGSGSVGGKSRVNRFDRTSTFTGQKKVKGEGAN